MFLDDRVLVELEEKADEGRFVVLTEIQGNVKAMRSSPTDQDGIFCTLFLIPQLADVKIRIVRRLEHV